MRLKKRLSDIKRYADNNKVDGIIFTQADKKNMLDDVREIELSKEIISSYINDQVDRLNSGDEISISEAEKFFKGLEGLLENLLEETKKISDDYRI